MLELYELGSLVLPVGQSVQEEYGMGEAIHSLSQIDLRAQEFQDMEVARRLQEEELMVPTPLLYQWKNLISTILIH